MWKESSVALLSRSAISPRPHNISLSKDRSPTVYEPCSVTTPPPLQRCTQARLGYKSQCFQ